VRILVLALLRVRGCSAFLALSLDGAYIAHRGGDRCDSKEDAKGNTDS